jgi:DNA-binding NtrC family response regulator
MLTAFGGVNQAVQAMQHGASDYLVKPVNLDELELVIRRTIEQSHLQSQKEWLSGSHRARHGPVMIGDSAPMLRLRQMIVMKLILSPSASLSLTKCSELSN